MAARALVILLALVSGAPDAAASPLVWQAPSGCPDAADMQRRIASRLGATNLTVHGIEITVVRDRGAYVATIDARALTVANDVRTLRSSRCEELADAVSVIVARLATEARDTVDRGAIRGMRRSDVSRGTDPRVAIDGRGGADGRDRIDPRRNERDDIDPVASMAPDTRTRDADRVAAADLASDLASDESVRGEGEGLGLVNRTSPRPGSTGTWGGGVHLTGLSGSGALPQLNLGVELAGYVRRLDRFLEIGVGRWVPQSEFLQPGAPARVDVSLEVVTVRAGWGPRHLPLRAWVTGEIGRMQGIGVAVDDPRMATSRWTALGGGFNVAWPMSPYARLVGAVELVFPLERTRFILDDGRDLYQPSAAAARCSLGIEVGWK